MYAKHYMTNIEDPKTGIKFERVEDIEPKDGKHFSYEEMREIVGGMVEIVPLPSGHVLVCNEEGKLTGLPVNMRATAEWQREYPLDKYPHNNDGIVVGNVLICDSDLIE